MCITFIWHIYRETRNIKPLANGIYNKNILVGLELGGGVMNQLYLLDFRQTSIWGHFNMEVYIRTEDNTEKASLFSFLYFFFTVDLHFVYVLFLKENLNIQPSQYKYKGLHLKWSITTSFVALKILQVSKIYLVRICNNGAWGTSIWLYVGVVFLTSSGLISSI